MILGRLQNQPGGCLVRYTVTVYPKELGLYKGDTHMHTVGSDGNCTLDEIAWMAEKQGLDYVIVTDHNNYAHNSQIRPHASVTMIPGAEWTHYKGHAGMLGVARPFDNPFCVNTPEEMREKFDEAGKRGALRVLNHPFCPKLRMALGNGRGGVRSGGSVERSHAGAGEPGVPFLVGESS